MYLSYSTEFSIIVKMIDIIHLNKDNRMLRIGFGKHEKKWFARLDLWFIGIRLKNGNTRNTIQKL